MDLPELEASLVYILSFRQAKATLLDPDLKTTKPTHTKQGLRRELSS